MKIPKLNNFVPLSLHFRKPGGQHSTNNLRKMGWPFILSCVVFAVVGMLRLSGKPSVVPEQSESDLDVFVRQGCPPCEKAKIYLTRLKQRYPQLTVPVRDIGEDPQALFRLRTLAAKFGIKQLGVPAFHARRELLIGFDSEETTGMQLEELLGRPPPHAGPFSEGACLVEPDAPCPPAPTQSDVRAQRIQIPLLGDRTLPKLGLCFFTPFIGLLYGANSLR